VDRIILILPREGLKFDGLAEVMFRYLQEDLLSLSHREEPVCPQLGYANSLAHHFGDWMVVEVSE